MGTVRDDPLIPATETADDGLPYLAGHKVEHNELAAFEAFCRERNRKKMIGAAALAGGVEESTVRKWRTQGWWKLLFEYFVQGHIQDMHKEMLDRSGEITDSFFDIVNGGRPADRSTGAAMQGILGFAKMGSAPLLETRAQVKVEQNVNSGNLTIVGHLDQDKLRALALANPAAILDMVRDSRIPDEYRIKR